MASTGRGGAAPLSERSKVQHRHHSRELRQASIPAGAGIGKVNACARWYRAPGWRAEVALGVRGFAKAAGQSPAPRLRFLFAAIVAVAPLLRGQHLDAETSIRAAAFGLSICR